MTKWNVSAFIAGICLLICGSLNSSAMAQGGADGGGTGGADPGGVGGGDPGGGTTTQGTGGTSTGDTGGVQGAQDAADPSDILDLQAQGVDRIEFEDNRIQGFVGQRDDNYYHPYSQFNQNALNGVTSAGGGGGGRAAGGGRGGGGAQNFFEVTRRSIRSRVRAAFSSPTVPNEVRASNYNGRLVKLPGMRQVGGTVKLQVQGRVGRLTGTVKNQDQKNMVERMARLEPGIYQIVNEIRIGN